MHSKLRLLELSLLVLGLDACNASVDFSPQETSKVSWLNHGEVSHFLTYFNYPNVSYPFFKQPYNSHSKWSDDTLHFAAVPKGHFLNDVQIGGYNSSGKDEKRIDGAMYSITIEDKQLTITSNGQVPFDMLFHIENDGAWNPTAPTVKTKHGEFEKTAPTIRWNYLRFKEGVTYRFTSSQSIYRDKMRFKTGTTINRKQLAPDETYVYHTVSESPKKNSRKQLAPSSDFDPSAGVDSPAIDDVELIPRSMLEMWALQESKHGFFLPQYRKNYQVTSITCPALEGASYYLMFNLYCIGHDPDGLGEWESVMPFVTKTIIARSDLFADRDSIFRSIESAKLRSKKAVVYYLDKVWYPKHQEMLNKYSAKCGAAFVEGRADSSVGIWDKEYDGPVRATINLRQEISSQVRKRVDDAIKHFNDSWKSLDNYDLGTEPSMPDNYYSQPEIFRDFFAGEGPAPWSATTIPITEDERNRLRLMADMYIRKFSFVAQKTNVNPDQRELGQTEEGETKETNLMTFVDK